MNATKPKAYLHSAMLSLYLIAALIGCTGSSSSNNGENDASGGVAFHLVWNEVPSRENSNYHSRLVTGDVCTDYRIQWIHAQAVDQSGNEQNSAMWPCSQGHGELSELPVGTYRIIVQGEVSGSIAWHGEVSGVQVNKNQQTDAGLIDMAHLYDHTPPIVVHTLPADGSLEVPVNSSLIATFDDSIVGQSIDAKNFLLAYMDISGDEIRVACTVSYDSDNLIAVLSPTAALLNDTTYIATIAVDQGLVVEDMAGNAMQQSWQWTFTTYRPDVEAPYIQSRVPVNATMGVALDAAVQLVFSEPINQLTVSANSVYLQHNGTEIQSSINYDSQNNRVTLTPTGDLSAGSTYTMIVTTDVTDLADNPLVGTDSWSFVTQFAPWHMETVGGVQSSWATAISLDSNDGVYISFQEAIQSDLMYAARDSDGVWDTRILSGAGDVGMYQDMVIGNYDTLHVGYYDASQSELLYYSEGLINGPAYGRIVDSVIDCQGVSIAVDATNRAYICYYEAASSQLRYTSEASGWVIETIDTGSGEYPGIAVEPTGEAHISYFDTVSGHLKYATNASGVSWVTETVDLSENVGHFTAIALDASGYPHISYFDDNTENLKYATKQPSGDWLIETVDSEGRVGIYSSIALDSLGFAHISYLDSSNTALKYATKTALGIWHTQIVDNNGTTGSGSSITVDQQDYIHISHCNFIAGGQLKYATTRPQN